jgi:hypothetical protein
MLSQTRPAKDWLSQFSSTDRGVAVSLLDALVLVNHEVFIDRLRAKIIESAGVIEGRVGLYAEREVRRYKGIPNRLFKEKFINGKCRAYGGGPKPVAPTRTLNPQVGSEGLIAWLVTELCREYPGKFVSHPGPDEIRDKENAIQSFFLVTDFIGSGSRASNYLSSAWRIASVRSWWSAGRFPFRVIAYSATNRGHDRVLDHAAQPDVDLVIPAPTIDTEFSAPERAAVRSICMKYDPDGSDPIASIGYDGTGALLVFGHGCPNNCPRILHRSKRSWKALFPQRVTAGSREHFKENRDAKTVAARLIRLGQRQLASSAWISRMTANGRAMVLVLAALRRGPRLDEALASRTGLTIPEVQSLIRTAIQFGWVDGQRHLTDKGAGQLAHLRRKQILKSALPNSEKSLYYPTSLRAP